MEEGGPLSRHPPRRAPRIVSYADLTVRASPTISRSPATARTRVPCVGRLNPSKSSTTDALRSASPTRSSTASAPWTSPVSCTPTTRQLEWSKVRACASRFLRPPPQPAENYVRHHGTHLNGFAEHNASSVIDTHPVLAIPRTSCASSYRARPRLGECLGSCLQDLSLTRTTRLCRGPHPGHPHLWIACSAHFRDRPREDQGRFRIDMAERGLD